jgi:peroxin-1
MPETAERQSILQAVSRGLTLAADVDLKSVAASTEGFTGADLQAIVSNAQLAHVHDLLDSKTTDSKQPSDAITALHMQNALKGARRSLSPQDVSRYKAIYDRFITDKTDKPQGFDPKGKLKTAQA